MNEVNGKKIAGRLSIFLFSSLTSLYIFINYSHRIDKRGRETKMTKLFYVLEGERDRVDVMEAI